MAFLRNWSELYSVKCSKTYLVYDHETETHFWTWNIPTAKSKIDQPQVHKHKAQYHQGGTRRVLNLLQV